jgi:NAD/NADP transhydrogenase alpha subunit
MPINIAVIRETPAGEQRVAIVPSVVGRIKKLGVDLSMQSGAGEAAKLPDALFRDVAFVPDIKSLVSTADVLAIQPSCRISPAKQRDLRFMPFNALARSAMVAACAGED